MEVKMSKTVTLRLKDNIYRLFSSLVESDKRPLSNFIETSALRYIEEHQYVDEFEMDEIKGNVKLNKSLKRGIKDAMAGKGIRAIEYK